MKITPHYNDSAFIVPGSVIDRLTDKNAPPVAPLLYALSKSDFTVSSAAAELGITEDEFISAVTEWERAGVVTVSEQDGNAKRTHKHTETRRAAKKTGDNGRESGSSMNSPEAKPYKLSSALPTYTTEETAKFLEDNKRTAEIIDSCENIIGKIFTTAETSIIVGMLDHLSLSGEYILLLFAHAVKMGKRSVRYIEKLALSLADRDITTYAELEEELARMELTESTLVGVRRMFGIGRRAFTAKEQQMVRDWCVSWSFGLDVIGMAYEITANSTGDASLPYANKILSSWHDAGLRTAAEVDAYISKKNEERAAAKHAESQTSSFDTDDFFEAALKRSYGD